MRVRISLRACAIVVAIGIVISFFAPAQVASAQDPLPTHCEADSVKDETTARPLASNGGHLLTNDGTGFFTENLSSMAVRSATTTAEVTEAASAVVQDLVGFYTGSDVAVVSDNTTDAARVVVIDGDIAVPGEPTVFTIGGVQTLYLHWTSATGDLTRLLDVPSFHALSVSNETACSGGGLAAPPLALNPSEATAAPDSILAYVDDEHDGADTASALDRLGRTPLADTAPTQQWPFPVAAAAVVVTTGGIVLYRRDKIWGERFAPTRRPAESLLEASQPELPVADLPPEMPRVIHIDGDEEIATQTANQLAVRREIDLHPERPESPLERSVEKISSNAYGVVLGRQDFASQVNIEWDRHQRGGSDGAVASLVLSELDAVQRRLGDDAAAQLFEEVADLVAEITRSLDVIGMANRHELAILMRNVDERKASQALDRITKKIAATTFEVSGERVLLTPATGFALLSDTQSAPDLIRAVEHARTLSMLNLHLDPERWGDTAEAPHAPGDTSSNRWATIKTKLRTPLQILTTVVIAWILPFFFYVGMAALGFDISFLVYLFLVSALVLTGAFILAEDGWR